MVQPPQGTPPPVAPVLPTATMPNYPPTPPRQPPVARNRPAPRKEEYLPKSQDEPWDMTGRAAPAKPQKEQVFQKQKDMRRTTKSIPEKKPIRDSHYPWEEGRKRLKISQAVRVWRQRNTNNIVVNSKLSSIATSHRSMIRTVTTISRRTHRTCGEGKIPLAPSLVVVGPL